jgi:hypothetical protein
MSEQQQIAPPASDWWRLSEVARYLDVPTSSAYRFVESGKIRSRQLPGVTIKYYGPDVISEAAAAVTKEPRKTRRRKRKAEVTTS